MSWARDNFIALDHVQVAMPPGAEAKARAFYGGVLGMSELKRPEQQAGQGGAWFAGGEGAAVQFRLSVDNDFRPARRARPAVLVSDIDGLAERLETAGHEAHWVEEADGLRRMLCDDPFGNRIEFVGEFALE